MCEEAWLLARGEVFEKAGEGGEVGGHKKMQEVQKVLYAHKGFHVVNSEATMLATDIIPNTLNRKNGSWAEGDLVMGAVSGVYTPTESLNVSCSLLVTGDLAAYYIGSWTLLDPGHGAFRGVTLQNQGAVQNGFLSTLDVQGGTWLLEHSEVRGALNSVIAARFHCNLTARRCGIGGWPDGDRERNAINGLSASGCSAARLHACSVDLCSNAGVRFMGNSSGEVFGCLLQLNNIHVSASEFAFAHLRLNTLLDTDRPRSPFPSPSPSPRLRHQERLEAKSRHQD
jgi:hypothetical protein